MDKGFVNRALKRRGKQALGVNLLARTRQKEEGGGGHLLAATPGPDTQAHRGGCFRC